MDIENWQIEYYMKTPRGVVNVKESYPCTKGYQQRYIEWCKQHDVDPNEFGPVCKVRGNYVQLWEEGGRDLPLEQRAELTNGELFVSDNHPITLVAPNGNRYINTEY